MIIVSERRSFRLDSTENTNPLDSGFGACSTPIISSFTREELSSCGLGFSNPSRLASTKAFLHALRPDFADMADWNYITFWMTEAVMTTSQYIHVQHRVQKKEPQHLGWRAILN